MWRWPSPGNHFVFGKKNDLPIKKKEDISNNFTLLRIDITQVDKLLLQKPINIRRRWILNNEWSDERINP